MSMKILSWLELARQIADRPTLYAKTPEVAHGVLESLAWVIICETMGTTLHECFEIDREILQETMKDIYPPGGPAVPLLCDESYRKTKVSFEAFRVNSQRYLEILEKRLA